MVSSELAPLILAATIQTPVVISSKKCAIAQGRSEVAEYTTFEGDDRLQCDFGSNPCEPLHATENGGKEIPDAIEDIAAGVGGYRLIQCQPPSGLPRHVQLENRLHGSHSLVFSTVLKNSHHDND